jgi:hypothetical protein
MGPTRLACIQEGDGNNLISKCRRIQFHTGMRATPSAAHNSHKRPRGEEPARMKRIRVFWQYRQVTSYPSNSTRV